MVFLHSFNQNLFFMLSIIVCSRNKSLSEIFVNNIVSTVGVEYEIIHIDNSESTYSIFSAYNLGIKKSKYPYLCFIHEDVLFHTKNWGDKIIAHLKDPKTGIIGVAGGDFVPRVPASWGTLISPGNNVIQSDSSGKKTTHQFSIPKDYSFTTRSSLIIDGLFLSMRSEMTDKIRFDENLKGFHGYDYDISLQSIIAGYKNYVIYDVKVEHFSRGGTNILYFRNLILVYKKWEKYLPLIGENVTDEEFKNTHGHLRFLCS